jgi:hypothetical protein
MPVDVVKEPPGSGGPAEFCCRCQKLTRYWYQPKDVALCLSCAAIVDDKDIPTKVEWFKQWRAPCANGDQ